ncbi:hypothetical protein V6Z11_A12G097600 [Gossypium hirsutum]
MISATPLALRLNKSRISHTSHRSSLRFRTTFCFLEFPYDCPAETCERGFIFLDFLDCCENELLVGLFFQFLVSASSFFFSLSSSSALQARSTSTTISFNSRIPTNALMSSLSPSSNRLHILASVGIYSLAYLLNLTNSLSYSVTIMFPCFNSRNSLRF